MDIRIFSITKEQFKENISSILEDKNVESIPLKNIEILNHILNDKELLNQMYKHFEDNFNLEFEDDNLYMKTEDFVYRLNMLVNDCVIPKYDFHDKEDIKNKVQELVDSNIDLYSGVSYDKSDRIVLDEFCELCNEMEINI